MTVNKGTIFEYIAAAGIGRNAVVVNGQIRVSTQYSKLV